MEASTEQITLRDGRDLAYSEFGDQQGAPLLFFHGWPSSRLEAGLLDERAGALGARLIAPDRPGFGQSTFLRGRTLLDWPDDVRELVDALDLRDFAVLGHSGGAPFAAACALRFDERLRVVGIVSGVGPPEAYRVQPTAWRSRWLRRIGRWAPWMLGPVLRRSFRQADRDPERFVADLGAAFPTVDQEVLARPAHREWLIQSGREAVVHGTAGAVLENALVNRAWGFELSSIRREVHLWHGELDATVPADVGRRVADSIPGCRATFSPEDGHVSLLATHADEVISTLAAGSSTPF